MYLVSFSIAVDGSWADLGAGWKQRLHVQTPLSRAEYVRRSFHLLHLIAAMEFRNTCTCTCILLTMGPLLSAHACKEVTRSGAHEF